MKALGFWALVIAVAGGALTGRAQIGYDLSPGTGPRPAMLGGYSLMPFPAESRAELSVVNTVAPPPPYSGQLAFDQPLEVDNIGSAWQSWNPSYSGAVYYDATDVSGVTSLTMTLPPYTRAFYFYLQPNNVSTFNFTVASGPASTPVTVTGSGGAQCVGFYAQNGASLTSITVDQPDGTAAGFAVAEFGIGVVYPPTIPTPPASLLAFAASNASFSVTAAGSPPLAYQWWFNGSPLSDGGRISGSVTPALTINDAQLGDMGAYSVVVSNLYGAATSSPAQLTLVTNGWPRSALAWKALGQTADGFYEILPDGLEGPLLNVYCLMSLAGGGWTKLNSDVAASDLNTNASGYREYLYVQDSTSYYYRTPVSQLEWSWSSGQDLYGTYSYSTGGPEQTFAITPSGEHQTYGVGGSSGGGGTYKCLGHLRLLPRSRQRGRDGLPGPARHLRRRLPVRSHSLHARVHTHHPCCHCRAAEPERHRGGHGNAWRRGDRDAAAGLSVVAQRGTLDGWRRHYG